MGMLFRALVLFSLFAFPEQALAEDRPSIKGVAPAEEAIFLAGAAQGITLMNLHAAMSGSAVFCPPVDFTLSIANMRSFASQGIVGEHDGLMFVVAAVDALRERFPCL